MPSAPDSLHQNANLAILSFFFFRDVPQAPATVKPELRSLYGGLCRDETPMVRRAAAHRLGDFAKAVEREHVARELLPLFTELTNDDQVRRRAHRYSAGIRCCSCCHCGRLLCIKLASRLICQQVQAGALVQNDAPLRTETRASVTFLTCVFSTVNPRQDSVRLLAVESCGKLAEALSPEDCRSQLLPLVHKFVGDKSWRVRYNVATQLVTLCNALGPEATRAELVAGYTRLLRDAEAEVRPRMHCS